jgi:hypothetical protein
MYVGRSDFVHLRWNIILLSLIIINKINTILHTAPETPEINPAPDINPVTEINPAPDIKPKHNTDPVQYMTSTYYLL